MATNDLQARFAANFAETFRGASQTTLKRAGQQFREVVNAYANSAKNGPMLERANKHLASLMRNATVNAYRQNVLAEAVPSYREGQGRYPHALLQVLDSPNFAVGSRQGIGFIDQNALDAKAVFWARLNFGAAPAEGSLPRPAARLRFGAGAGGSFELTDRPSAGFSVPSAPARIGYFNSRGQFNIGAPHGGAARIVKSKPSVHGIGARRFLDAGLVALANNFKQVYHDEIQEMSRTVAARSKNVRIRR